MRRALSNSWRPPALGLAAVAFLATCALAQACSLAEFSTGCGACHGEDGNSRTKNIPSLAGQPESSPASQLILMREGCVASRFMTPFVKDLTDADAEALAKHFNKLAPQGSGEPIDPALVKRGGEIAAQRRCGSCTCQHSPGRIKCRGWRRCIDYLILT